MALFCSMFLSISFAFGKVNENRSFFVKYMRPNMYIIGLITFPNDPRKSGRFNIHSPAKNKDQKMMRHVWAVMFSMRIDA